MLPALLPSWLHDLSGAAATLNMTELVNSSLFPLLFVVPVAIVVLLLLDRNQGAGASEGSSSNVLDGMLDRRSLPQSAANDQLLAVARSSWSKSSQRLKAPLVLIADDSAVVRHKLSRLLVGAGFRVVEAADGQQALDAIQSGELPAVLITDLEMPVVDGFELIAAVHGAMETEHMPIIAITGRDDLRAQVGDLNGLYGIFKKPWNDRALLRRVQALVAVAGAVAY